MITIPDPNTALDDPPAACSTVTEHLMSRRER
ncbi:hypothetical protein SAMN04489718_0530 [Actinopolyspora saharensis]|uniref:Uncharacterized protein n=1 Tax=Actinopolyspora saharensis TaxID=995062 RepID=A0A1H0YL56_9ACTN|nr:hypothetical protein SAMN04489718_0530 [Actinopolyspora saharensis]